eukprot:jgi/Botrbrau1/16697/Bobra.0213s0002.1
MGLQRSAVERMRAAGVEVLVSTLDVSNRQEAAELMKIASSMAPIAGIFHLAMNLQDKLLSNQTGEGWNGCVKPKAMGAYNLDLESRQLKQPLDAFVMFSTAISEMGNAGQANYGYGNQVLNEICKARTAANVPGINLAIMWGSIGDVGFFAEKQEAHFTNSFEFMKLALQPIDNCLQKLGYLLAGGDAAPTVAGVRAYALAKPRLDKIGTAITTGTGPGSDSGSGDSLPREDLVSAVLAVMGVTEQNIGENGSLSQLGIDSMQVVEVRAILQRELGRPFPLDQVGALTLGKLRALAGGKV